MTSAVECDSCVCLATNHQTSCCWTSQTFIAATTRVRFMLTWWWWRREGRVNYASTFIIKCDETAGKQYSNNSVGVLFVLFFYAVHQASNSVAILLSKLKLRKIKEMKIQLINSVSVTYLYSANCWWWLTPSNTLQKLRTSTKLIMKVSLSILSLLEKSPKSATKKFKKRHTWVELWLWKIKARMWEI